MRCWVLAGLLFLAPALADDEEPDLGVVQSVSTAHGTLEVRQDARLTKDIAEKVLNGACFDSLVEHDARLKLLRDSFPANAQVRLLDKQGHLTHNDNWEWHALVARIEARRYGPKADPFYVVHYVDSFCDGDHVRDTTRFFQFKLIPAVTASAPEFTEEILILDAPPGLPEFHPILQPVHAVNSDGVLRRVRLVRTRDANWRFFRNSRLDILIGQVECMADYKPGSVTSKIVYTTFQYDGERWRYATREEPGIWKSGDVFPDRSKFPPLQD